MELSNTKQLWAAPPTASGIGKINIKNPPKIHQKQTSVTILATCKRLNFNLFYSRIIHQKFQIQYLRKDNLPESGDGEAEKRWHLDSIFRCRRRESMGRRNHGEKVFRCLLELRRKLLRPNRASSGVLH